MRVEHDMAIICQEMSQNGFYFDIDTAEALQRVVESDMKVLEDSFATTFPPQLVEVNRIKNRQRKDGSLYKNVEEAMSSYPLTSIEGDELVCFDYKKFNPGSTKDRLDVLWEAGWKPTEMTKGYKKFLRENRV